MKKVTDSDFESAMRQAKPAVVVKFTAAWCPPCRVLGKLLEQVAPQWEGEVDFLEVDIDESPRTVAAFGVGAVPTLVAFRGRSEVERLMGAHSRPAVEGFLSRI